jgi:excisionase family DNA binding protein
MYTGHESNGGHTMDERSQGGRDRLLTPGEVAALFRVDPKTVTRWAAAGRIGSIRTPGGHRRFRESEVRALLAGETGEPASIPEQTGPSSDRLTPSP